MTQIIADLQLHSRFSRAVSPAMTIPNIAMWARRKGIGLVATGDWTHPMWFREIERDLEELGSGLLRLRPGVETNLDPKVAGQQKSETKPDHDPLFLLATEVSCIYSQNGKGRRVHTLIWVPAIDAARKISKEMTKRGCNLLSDGRPIIGLTSINVAELVFSIEPKALVIPAHCLLPNSMVLGEEFVPKRIDSISEGESVLTHIGKFHKVMEVKKRAYKGEIIHIQPWYFRPGLITTPEHPYYAIRTIKKCSSTGDICRPSKSHLALCKRKSALQYMPGWIMAKDLEVGDVLVYPRSRVLHAESEVLLDADKQNDSFIRAGGTRGKVVGNTTKITPEFGRLIGYYLAEGSTDGANSFSFCFSEEEQNYVLDVIAVVREVFGIHHHRVYRRKGSKGVEVVFYSKLHAQWFARNCYERGKRHIASNKTVPGSVLRSGEGTQAECLRGWFRGDSGYTSSRILVNQMKVICLRIGIIPSILLNISADKQNEGNHRIGSRIIKANYDLYVISTFSFFEDPYDLKKEMPRSQTKLDRKHGWIDDQYVYLPIKDITKRQYRGDVYNLEVEEDHSYVAEYAAVHNCWTPWFSVFGSMSGFASLEEAFGPYAKQIYAVETGLSSNPSMNWQIPELDSRAILSFSDAHSGPKLGREATVFEIQGTPDTLTYADIYDAISARSLGVDDATLKARIVYTIEFYPEEGKYHWSGHRACSIRWGPLETQKNGNTCPVCGKPLTQGVEQRVGELSGRGEKDLRLSIIDQPLHDMVKVRMTKSNAFPERPPFTMMVPLVEIIAEAIGSPVASPKVQVPYFRLTDEVGSEFFVLLEAEISAIAKVAGERVALGVKRVRQGELAIDPGYDGVFGVVKIWKNGEKSIADSNKEQLTLLS